VFILAFLKRGMIKQDKLQEKRTDYLLATKDLGDAQRRILQWQPGRSQIMKPKAALMKDL